MGFGAKRATIPSGDAGEIHASAGGVAGNDRCKTCCNTCRGAGIERSGRRRKERNDTPSAQVLSSGLQQVMSIGLESGTGEHASTSEGSMTDIARLFQAFLAPAIFVSAGLLILSTTSG